MAEKNDLQYISTPSGRMLFRTYAAIKLKVPDSGLDWLDEMITRSFRNEVAQRVLVAQMSLEPFFKAIGRKAKQESKDPLLYHAEVALAQGNAFIEAEKTEK